MITDTHAQTPPALNFSRDIAPSEESPMAHPDTETRLLDLFESHLKSTEQAITSLGSRVDNLAEKIDKTSDRLFWLACAILLVLAASSGANLYVSYGGAVVSTTSSP